MNNRFVVLTGHLNDYALSDLIGILRHQQKTGRLLIEYPKAPASFYFEEGELVDVQLDGLAGLQAICVAMAQPAANFNFNPLIRASQRSLDSSLRQVVSELFGCWDETPMQLEAVVVPRPELQEPLAIPEPAAHAALSGPEVLALPPFVPPVNRQNRTIFAMGAVGLLLLGISSVIAVTGGFQGKVESVSLAASTSAENVPAGTTRNNDESKSVPSNEEQQSGIPADSAKPRDFSTPASKERHRDARSSRERQNAPKSNVEPSSNPQTVVQDQAPTSEKNSKTETAAKAQMVDVVMHIENGRVLQAAIANHKSGMDGYEALALRIARQRRYPPKANGQETVRIRVGQPD